MTAQRFDSLTAMRGIAAVLVVVYHYTGSFLPHLDPGVMTQFVAKGYLWVDFFFLLSGFVLAHAYGATFTNGLRRGDVKTFTIARFARIYPLHLVVLAGFVLLEVLKRIANERSWGSFPDTFEQSKSVASLAANVAMLQTTGLLDRLTWNGPAWSVGAEWIAYLVFPLLVLASGRFAMRGQVVMMVLVAAGLAWISGWGRNLDLTHDYGLWRCIFGVMAGLILYRMLPLARRFGLGRDAVAVLLMGAVVMMMHIGARDIFIPPLFAVLLLALALNDGRVGQGLANRTLCWLGRISYAIYLVHMLVLEALGAASRAMWGQGFGRFFDTAQSIMVVGALLVAIIGLSHLLHVWVEEPARRFIRSRTYRAPTGLPNAVGG